MTRKFILTGNSHQFKYFLNRQYEAGKFTAEECREAVFINSIRQIIGLRFVEILLCEKYWENPVYDLVKNHPIYKTMLKKETDP